MMEITLGKSTMDLTGRAVIKRNEMLNEFFRQLSKQNINYTVIRGYKGLFSYPEKDVDLLINPSDFSLISDVFKGLISNYKALNISNVVSGKNLYMKSLIVSKADNSIEALYIHCVGFLTVKTSEFSRKLKGFGRRIWLKDVDSEEISIEGVKIFIPVAKFRALFSLMKLSQGDHKKKVVEFNSIIMNNSLEGWMQALCAQITTTESIFPVKGGYNRDKLSSLSALLAKELIAESGPILYSEYLNIFWKNLLSICKLKGSIVFFSGPDGAGKTTANNALSEVLVKKLNIKIINQKALYPLSNKMQKKLQPIQAKIRNLDASDAEALERDRGESNIWRLRRLGGLIFLLIQVWPGYILARWKNLKGVTVIVDTAFFDMFIKGHRPPFPVLRKVSLPLLPSGDFWFMMKADPLTIVERKPELTKQEIVEYYKFFSEINCRAGKKMVTIDSSRGIKLALTDILQVLGSK